MNPERLKYLIKRFQGNPEMVAALQRQLDEALRVQYPADKSYMNDPEVQRYMADNGEFDKRDALSNNVEALTKADAAGNTINNPVNNTVTDDGTDKVVPVFTAETHGDGSEIDVPWDSTPASNLRGSALSGAEASTGMRQQPIVDAATGGNYDPNWNAGTLSRFFSPTYTPSPEAVALAERYQKSRANAPVAAKPARTANSNFDFTKSPLYGMFDVDWDERERLAQENRRRIYG